MLLFLSAAAALAGLAGAAWIHRWLFTRGLPRISGTVRLTGLSHPVDVIRDSEGIPHLFAQTLEDASFAHGFVHAQDRLWQMELNRRVASGRISEFTGKNAIPADRFLRRVGLRRAAQREADALHPAERGLLDAYARGVNAAVKDMGKRLPLEMRLLRIHPEPWSAVDSLCWSKFMSLNLATNFEMELFRARLVAKVGVARAVELHLPHAPGAPPIVPSPAGSAPATDPPVESVPGVEASAAELTRLYEEAKPYFTLGGMGASNNWVVAGRRSASGRPMLANDPHLLLQIPSLWHEVHWVTPEVDVYGVALPGAPGVILGHNRHVAWGFTNSGADVQDLFIERFDTSQPDRYQTPDGWRTAERVREVIRVKGGADVVEEVFLTRHGPVLVGGPGQKGPALALKWTAFDPGHTVEAVLAMNRARSAREFRQALAAWPGPSQNVVFADEADIGYVMAGDVPRRRKGSGFLPVPGWVDDYAWDGNIPFAELPQLWNPPSGLIVTANNPVVDRGFAHPISWDWMNGYRAERIRQRLEAGRPLTPADFADIQRDVFCAPGLAFAKACGRLTPKDPVEQQALASLITWDGYARPESAGAAVYEVMMVAAVRGKFEPELGPELMADMLGRSFAPIFPAGLLVGRYVGLVLRGLQAEPQAWQGILARALTQAVQRLSAELGPNPATWQWGAIHRLRLRHPLAASKVLRVLFEERDVPLGGDSDTPFQAAYAPHQPFHANAWAPSWRQVVDLADVKSAVSIHPTGQSGHTRSRHHLDFFERWYRGGFHAHWLDRPDVEAHAEATLRLEPLAP